MSESRIMRRTASVHGVLISHCPSIRGAYSTARHGPLICPPPPVMRTLKLSRLERALVRKLYIRRYTAATLMRMFRCCQTTVNRAVRNHMGDDIDDDEAIIRNADVPADVSAMLGLTKECDDDKAFATPNRWRPWALTRGVIPRIPVPRSLPRTVTRRSPKVCLCHHRHALSSVNFF